MKEIQARSAEMQALLRALEIAAATDVTLMLQGESGTGKEVLAGHAHHYSRRSDRPMSCLNCAAIPEGLAEAMLFGHTKGAFTDAIKSHTGYLQEADGGTLFLDEISELSPAVQAKLLRCLESGEIQPVGSTTTRRVDVRFIVASNKDLRDEVAAGRFREDLYYRLSVLPFTVPALRERRDDIPLLLEHFIGQFAVDYRLAAPRFTRAAIKALQAYGWPGNVRELKNFCERMLILCGGQLLDTTNLPAEIFQGLRQPDAEAGMIVLPDEGLSLSDVEVSLIRQALVRAGGNRSRAARLLGLSRDTLLYRLKKYDLA